MNQSVCENRPFCKIFPSRWIVNDKAVRDKVCSSPARQGWPDMFAHSFMKNPTDKVGQTCLPTRSWKIRQTRLVRHVCPLIHEKFDRQGWPDMSDHPFVKQHHHQGPTRIECFKWSMVAPWNASWVHQPLFQSCWRGRCVVLINVVRAKRWVEFKEDAYLSNRSPTSQNHKFQTFFYSEAERIRYLGGVLSCTNENNFNFSDKENVKWY